MPTPLDKIDIVECQDISDIRGGLFVFTLDGIVPFEVKRIFYVYDVPVNAIRGRHGHYRCHQFMICQKGRLLVTVTDGRATRNIELRSGQAVLVEPLTFAEQTYLEPDSILLVLCDRQYEEDDYIRDVETLRAYLTGSDRLA
jgi:UDP-2-acetamido-3-amino-2,3-dideoxy-glucuronate N-acetyltransferase